MFGAAIDLLTTVDDALKGRLARLPLARHWLRKLRVHAAFVGTTVSEYVLWLCRGEPSELLAAVLRRWGRHFMLLIVKDIAPSIAASQYHGQPARRDATARLPSGRLRADRRSGLGLRGRRFRQR